MNQTGHGSQFGTLRLTVAACCVFAACAVSDRQTGSARPRSQLGAGNAAIASAAVERFREQFNTGECGLIYQGASDEFHGLESREDWLAVCRQLHAGLGSWKSLTAESIEASEGFAVRVRGTGGFANGSCRFRITLSVADRTPRLFSLWLQGAGLVVAVPTLCPDLHRLVDPPLRIPSALRVSGQKT